MTRAPAEVGSAANSYEILAKLAMGGMAEIFLAKGANNAGVERYVVLKRVLRHRADDAHFVRMFLDEARLASQLQHPNIAQVYDIGKLGDSYFFTMEYVHGETVRTLLQRTHGLRRQIPISTVLAIIAGSAAGLHHAHERKGYDGKPLGIVHRDVSPSNLMVSYEGTVKVVDFGVAKAEHRTAETHAGTVKGKISYMSPEQCKGGQLDRRSDLFSLGILMWEMLTSERLFRKESDFEAMQAIVNEDVPPPSTIRADVPPEIDAIVMKLLAKKPADRFQTADELHEAIENVAVRTGSPISSTSLGRYMRELFGQRPEPWIELQAVDARPEVTVTSEPIPSVGDYSLSASELMDVRLDEVPELGQLQQIAQHTKPAAMPTVPLRVTADPDLAPTMQLPPGTRTSSPNVPDLRPHTPSTTPSSSSNIAMHTPSGGMPRAHPQSTSQSNPQYPMLSSSQHAAYRASASNIAAKRSKLPYILVPALVLGVIVGIALAFGTSAEKKMPTAHSTEPPGQPVVMATTSIDAAAAEIVLPDERPVTPPTVPPEVVVAAAQPPDIATLYTDHKYSEVVAACNASKTAVTANATSCTVAACKQREVSKARRWFASVAAAKKSSVQRECGTILPADKPRPADDECKRDPLACQH